MNHPTHPATHGEFRNGLNARELHFMTRRGVTPAFVQRDQADAQRLARYTQTQDALARLARRLGGTKP